MLISPHILARGDNDLISTLIYVGFFVVAGLIGAISKWLQARAEKRRQEEARERAAGRRFAPMSQPSMQQAPQHPHAAQPMPQLQQRRTRAAPPPVPTVLRPAEIEGPERTMAQEIEAFGKRESQLQRREEELELRRQRKLAQARKAAQASRNEPARTELDVAPEMQYENESAAGGYLGRLDAEKLRQAIIYRELLSPPKALRKEPDSWEL